MTFQDQFVSILAQKDGGGDDKNKAHQEIAAISFGAAVQLFQSALGEQDVEASLRARAQELTDLADLVKAAKEKMAEEETSTEDDKPAADDKPAE